MSKDKFDDNCDDCKPAILDIQTGKPLDDAEPIMRSVMSVWQQTTRREREAYHRVMCNNSRDTVDLELTSGVVQKIQAAIGEAKTS